MCNQKFDATNRKTNISLQSRKFRNQDCGHFLGILLKKIETPSYRFFKSAKTIGLGLV